MPTTARNALTTASTYHCYRCGKDKPDGEFYHYADGRPISGCKQCHNEMAADRRKAKHAAPAAPAAPTALTTREGPMLEVDNSAPLPAEATYQCEGCARRVRSARTEGPRGWKRVRLTAGEDAATLCTRCVITIQRAAEVVTTVAKRRHHGKGQAH